MLPTITKLIQSSRHSFGGSRGIPYIPHRIFSLRLESLSTNNRSSIESTSLNEADYHAGDDEERFHSISSRRREAIAQLFQKALRAANDGKNKPITFDMLEARMSSSGMTPLEIEYIKAAAISHADDEEEEEAEEEGEDELSEVTNEIGASDTSTAGITEDDDSVVLQIYRRLTKGKGDLTEPDVIRTSFLEAAIQTLKDSKISVDKSSLHSVLKEGYHFSSRESIAVLRAFPDEMFQPAKIAFTSEAQDMASFPDGDSSEALSSLADKTKLTTVVAKAFDAFLEAEREKRVREDKSGLSKDELEGLFDAIKAGGATAEDIQTLNKLIATYRREEDAAEEASLYGIPDQETEMAKVMIDLLMIQRRIKQDGSGKFKCTKCANLSFTHWYDYHLHSRLHDPIILSNLGYQADAHDPYGTLELHEHAHMIVVAEKADRANSVETMKNQLTYMRNVPESKLAEIGMSQAMFGLPRGLLLLRSMDSSLVDTKGHLKSSFQKDQALGKL